jgi:hypothetical protein
MCDKNIFKNAVLLTEFMSRHVSMSTRRWHIHGKLFIAISLFWLRSEAGVSSAKCKRTDSRPIVVMSFNL